MSSVGDGWMLHTLACQPSSRVAIFFEQFSGESLKICIAYRCKILLHFHTDLFCYWLISLHKVVPKVWLFTLELWVPEVPKHVKDVESGKRKMRSFFGSVAALWSCLSCLQRSSSCSVDVCQAPCHPAIVQARNQPRLPLFYTQICSYRLFCPISLHSVMLVKYSVISQLW